MSSTLVLPDPPPGLLPTELVNGDRLTQPEFHELYLRSAEKFKAELIGGIVFVASPVKSRHAEHHLPISGILMLYEASTPGVRAADNATIILDGMSEPQPDLHLRLLPEYGGQCKPEGTGYLVGPPEFVCEISDSTRSLDLNAKKRDYTLAGIHEYFVVNLRDGRTHWFDLVADQELFPDSDSVARIRVFPGLWIHTVAAVTRDLPRLLTTAQEGLATPEHAAFVAALADRKSR